MCLPYNVLRKGKILVSTFVGLRRGEGRTTAPDWSEEKMRGKVKSKKRLSLILADVGGQHCPCPVRVLFLSGFSGKSCPVSVCCPDSVRIFCPVSVCPDSVCLESVRCPDSVRILRKKAVRCLSVRIFSTSILSAVGILSGFLENRLSGVCPSGLCSKIVCPVSVWILSVWTSIDIITLSGHRHLSIQMWTQNFKTPTQTRTRTSERT